MIQEDKELLLKDLYARLPYGFIIHRYSDNCNIIIESNRIDDFTHFLEYSEGEDFKPYLRPMSSMTEEECKTLGNISATLENRLVEILPNIPYYIEVAVPDQIDWLNAHHFDYRGLIDKGLALEAPKNMYNIKEK